MAKECFAAVTRLKGAWPARTQVAGSNLSISHVNVFIIHSFNLYSVFLPSGHPKQLTKFGTDITHKSKQHSIGTFKKSFKSYYKNQDKNYQYTK